MNSDQVEKDIQQMRSIFGFFGIGFGLWNMCVLFAEGPNILHTPFFLVIILTSLLISSIFLIAFIGLGRRTKTGYISARVASVILLLGFPILTVFGISYLSKLSKPEVKQAFKVKG